MRKKKEEITEKTLNTRKKRITKKKIILSIATIAVIGGGTALIFKNHTNKASAETGRTVFDTEVKTGNITNSIESSGTLAEAGEVYVQIPSTLTVDEVLVESGDKVKKGDQLAKLNKASICNALVDVEKQLDDIEDDIDDADSDYEEEALTYEKEDLETLHDLLLAYYESPVITASADGIIGEVNVSASSSKSEGMPTVSDAGSITIEANEVTALSTAPDTGDASASIPDTNPPTGNNTDIPAAPDGTDKVPATAETQTTEANVISDYSKLIIEAPKAGNTPQTTIEETEQYKGEISFDVSGETFEAGKAYSATVILKAKTGYKFTKDALPTIEGASYTYEIDKDENENTLKLVITFKQDTSSKGTVDNTSSDDKKETPTNIDVPTTTEETKTDDTKNEAQEAANVTISNTKTTTASVKTGGSTGSVSSSTASTGSSQSASSSSSVSYTNAFSIITTDTVKVTVNVDELDILSVEEGQSATITLDALENETFTGTVTDVAETSNSSSSSSKYAVEIDIPMDDDMRIGMSASASINISEANDVLTIPMTALQQKKGETFVYTTKDEDGNLGGEVTVETGLSDGSNVEITSGLKEGDTVYYYREASESSSGSPSFGNFDFSKMGGNGDMPTPPSGDFKGFSGGEKPSGERPSGSSGKN